MSGKGWETTGRGVNSQGKHSASEATTGRMVMVDHHADRLPTSLKGTATTTDLTPLVMATITRTRKPSLSVDASLMR